MDAALPKIWSILTSSDSPSELVAVALNLYSVLASKLESSNLALLSEFEGLNKSITVGEAKSKGATSYLSVYLIIGAAMSEANRKKGCIMV